MSIIDQIQKIRSEFRTDLEQFESKNITLDNIKVKYLGRKGLVANLFVQMSKVSTDERPIIGKDLNLLKTEISNQIDTFSKTTNLANPFQTTYGSKTVAVFHSSHGFTTGTLITISNSSKIGGIDRGFVNTSHVITVPNDPLTVSGNLHVYNLYMFAICMSIVYTFVIHEIT